jgi:two-component system CheB/CheR fusion protein
MQEVFGAETGQSDESARRLLVVGLGASAGGIKALKDFFANVPPETGAAYVVILHLSPDHDSRLAEVLQTTAPMPVTQVTSAVRVLPDHVYVVPPNKRLHIADGMLTVADFQRAEERRAPVDVFFRALADAHGSRSVVVILSGTGPNGSAGLKRVKEYGGLVIAQQPDEADFPDMPRNSIATGLVDLVLPAAQMPPQIAAYFQHLRGGDEEPVVAALGADDLESLRDVMTMLRVRTGHDFSNYKAATVQRRIERRMTLRGIATLVGYSRLIRQEPDEAVALMKELLISVTNFFRDSAAWLSLEQRVIPRIFLNKGSQEQVRVWVAGCATGEEAYSMAMLLAEYSSTAVDQPGIQIFATDLDQQAVAVARDGVYTEADVADISEERLQRFFHREAGGYRVRRELRELVLFAHHNLIKDPPFSHLDLISCRNLLIYLNRSIQERLLETFHFALRPGSYLFLGTSETPDDSNDLFLRFDTNSHIYESRTVTSRIALPPTYAAVPVPRTETRIPEARPPDRILPADLHQRLLEQYAPPSVIITEEHNVVHMSERAGRYLQIRGGEPSRDLMALIRSELRPDLRTALHEAVRERRNIDVRGIAVPIDDAVRLVDLAIRPVLREGDPARGYFLVTFDERDQPPSENDATPVTLTSPAEPLTRQLEEELTRVKSQLRATVEQYETQVEEAKASNEELQAMNEELRSAAEELETSKEELQSVNEELTTVNQELKVKIEELGLTNNDFQNFINATDIGTIFLDRSLRVKFSTPRAREVFNLLDTDIGRPLSDITNKLLYGGIHKDVRDVLDRLATTEREVQTEDGRWHLLRLLPYRTSDNHIDGVVLTFHDSTERRSAETRVRLSEERLRALIDSALDYAIFTMTAEGIVDSWNTGAERMFGYAADDIVGLRADILFTPDDRSNGVPARELDEARRLGRANDERYHVRKNGTRFFCSGITRRLGASGGFAKIARDLTAQRQSAEALQRAHDNLEGRVRDRTAQLEAAVSEHDSAKTAVTHLLHRVVNAQEDERRRIARDLHDHFGQQLTALRLALERVRDASSDGGGHGIEQALTLTEQISRDVDLLSWELRPAVLDELGLGAALPRFVAEWSAHVGIAAECRVGNFNSDALPREAQVAFYRIAQEALNNVAKHAHASRAEVVLAISGGEVVLVVEDDGIGFEPGSDSVDRRGLGLASMRERASLAGASLQLESSIGKGTSVFLRRPLSSPTSVEHGHGTER